MTEHVKQDKKAIIDLLQQKKNEHLPYELFTGDSGDFLTCVFKSGNQTSLPYHLITKIDFDPSQGITITFTEWELNIEGQKLEELVQLLRTKRVDKLKENLSEINTNFVGFKSGISCINRLTLKSFH